MTKKLPNPCVDVCKYKRAGHCIACSMSKAQKSLSKALKSAKHREAFLTMLVAQQEAQGGYPAWAGMYRKKCKKRGAVAPDFISDAR